MDQGQLAALREDADIRNFVISGTPTGKELGSGSYGSVVEVIAGYVCYFFSCIAIM